MTPTTNRINHLVALSLLFWSNGCSLGSAAKAPLLVVEKNHHKELHSQNKYGSSLPLATRSLYHEGHHHSGDDRPDKGNGNICYNAEGELMPCFLPPPPPPEDGDDYREDGTAYDPTASGFAEDDHYYDPSLGMWAGLEFYVSLRPHTQSIGKVLTRVVTQLLNHSMEEIEFHLPPKPPHHHHGGGGGSGGDGGGGDGPGDGDFGGGGGGRGGGQRKLRRRLEDVFTDVDEDQTIIYRLYLSKKLPPDCVKQGEERWWWKYKLMYNCFWAHSAMPVEDESTRLELSHNMTEVFIEKLAVIQQYVGDAEDDLGINIAMDESEIWIDGDPESFADDATGANLHADTKEPTFTVPLDSKEWGPTRYLGLALFLFIFVTGMLLTQFGAMRRRQRIRKQVWSNLASEEGVKDLLKTGWVLKGNRMEVYDKSKLGYNDNDSMLIGGYEQKTALVGSEIRISNGDSVNTGTHSGTRSGELSSRDFRQSYLAAGEASRRSLEATLAAERTGSSGSS